MGYSGLRLWVIFWDILVKHCCIYLSKLWDILLLGYIKQKLGDVLGNILGYIGQTLWGILAKTMGYIRKNRGIYGLRL